MLMEEAITLWLTGSIDICFEIERKVGEEENERGSDRKEEETEKGDCGPPTRSVFFFFFFFLRFQ